MIARELTDKEMAVNLISRMDNRVSLPTIIERLRTVSSAVELAGMIVRDGIVDEFQAVEWLTKLINSYEKPQRAVPKQ
jgi:hypothetical protein